MDIISIWRKKSNKNFLKELEDFDLVVTNELTLFLVHHFSRFRIKEMKLFVPYYHKLSNINGFSYTEP